MDVIEENDSSFERRIFVCISIDSIDHLIYRILTILCSLILKIFLILIYNIFNISNLTILYYIFIFLILEKKHAILLSNIRLFLDRQHISFNTSNFDSLILKIFTILNVYSMQSLI